MKAIACSSIWLGSIATLALFLCPAGALASDTWTQVNSDGFGLSGNREGNAFCVFDNYLYVSVYNASTGFHLYRSTSGNLGTWDEVVNNGLGYVQCRAVDSMAVYEGRLYLGVRSDQYGARIWSSTDGTTFDCVTNWGLYSDVTDTSSENVCSMVVFNGRLYASTLDTHTTSGWGYVGAEIWRSTTSAPADQDDWERVVADGFGISNTRYIFSMCVHNGYLYAGTYNPTSGATVWRSATGDAGDWTQVSNAGFDNGILYTRALASFGSHVYIAFGDKCEIWRAQNPTQQSDWAQVVADATVSNQLGFRSMVITEGTLYAGTRGDPGYGCEVWRSDTGAAGEWTVSTASTGFDGSVANGRVEAMGFFEPTEGNGYVYAPTYNSSTGTELWRSSNFTGVLPWDLY